MPDGVRTIPLWFWCGMDEMMKNRPNVRSKLQSRPEQRQPGIFVRCGVREGAVLTLGSRERIRIGREVPCELVMPSQKISRIHCTVEFDEEQKMFLVTDTSKNGVYLQKIRIPFQIPVMLPPGTVLSLTDESQQIVLLG